MTSQDEGAFDCVTLPLAKPSEPIAAKFPYAKVASQKDWDELEQKFSTVLSRDVKIVRNVKEQMAQRGEVSGRQNSSPSSGPAVSRTGTVAVTTVQERSKRIIPRSESCSFKKRIDARELALPRGGAPVLHEVPRLGERWHAWEWCSDGALTKYLENNGVRCGPVINWTNGWDPPRGEDRELLKKMAQDWNPRVLMVYLRFC